MFDFFKNNIDVGNIYTKKNMFKSKIKYKTTVLIDLNMYFC